MMIRAFYYWVLCLHPAQFRSRFGDEMFWIFQQADGTRARLRLFADGLLSLVRQWALRPKFRKATATAVAIGPRTDGVPLFYTADTSLPRLSANEWWSPLACRFRSFVLRDRE